MTRKQVLNVTSQKKRDTMVSTYRAGSGASAAVGSASLTGGGQSMVVWCATARDNTVSSGGAGAGKFQTSSRTATTCYFRGLSEKIFILTNTAVPWEWRRICFCFRNNSLILPGITPYSETSNGFARLSYNITSGSATDNTALAALTTYLFKGVSQVDFNSFLTAPVDTTRVDLKFDKTVSIRPDTGSGYVGKFNRWHPMNKNLVYDDDERAGGKDSSFFSVFDKRGMGDYYVVDYFVPAPTSTSADTLQFWPQASLYWHER